MHLSLHFDHVTNERLISAIDHEKIRHGSGRLVAILASAPDFDHWSNLCETGMFRGCANALGQFVVVDMSGLATGVADQEDAVVETAGMLVGDIGIGALDAAGKIGPDEQVQDSIDAIGRDPLSASLRYRFRNIVSGRRPVEVGERIEDRGPHFGPLFASLDDPASGCVAQ